MLRLRPPPSGSPLQNSWVWGRLSLGGCRLRAQKWGTGIGSGVEFSSVRKAASENSRSQPPRAGKAEPRCSVSRALHRSWTPRRWSGRCAKMWFPPYGTFSSTWPCCESVSVLPGGGRKTGVELADTAPLTQALTGLRGLFSWAERSQGARDRCIQGSGRMRALGSAGQSRGTEVHAVFWIAWSFVQPCPGLRAFELK